MSHFWPEGVAIEVNCALSGAPQRLYWNGQRHKVAELVRLWRIDDDWWQTAVERNYYKLITDSGLLLIIFYDGERWFLQRIYD